MNSEFAIRQFVCHCNVNSIQNSSTVSNPTIEPYCILLPRTLPCRTVWQNTNSLLSKVFQSWLTWENTNSLLSKVFQSWFICNMLYFVGGEPCLWECEGSWWLGCKQRRQWSMGGCHEKVGRIAVATFFNFFKQKKEIIFKVLFLLHVYCTWMLREKLIILSVVLVALLVRCFPW